MKEKFYKEFISDYKLFYNDIQQAKKVNYSDMVKVRNNCQNILYGMISIVSNLEIISSSEYGKLYNMINQISFITNIDGFIFDLKDDLELN